MGGWVVGGNEIKATQPNLALAWAWPGLGKSIYHPPPFPFKAAFLLRLRLRLAKVQSRIKWHFRVKDKVNDTELYYPTAVSVSCYLLPVVEHNIRYCRT